MNGNLKILVLLVTLSLVSAFAFAPTEVWAGDYAVRTDLTGPGHLDLTASGTTDTTDGDTDPGDGSGGTEGDPDDLGGGFGARDQYLFWGAEYEGEELETLERWLLLLMLQVLPTP